MAVGVEGRSAASPTTGFAPRSKPALLVALALAIVVVLVAGIVLAAAGITYEPKFRLVGTATWPATPSRLAVVTDGLGHETWAVIGPTETRATVVYSLGNAGTEPITLLGLKRDSMVYGEALRFAPLTIETAHGIGRSPTLKESRPGPWVLKPGGAAALFLTVIKPRCSSGSISELEGFAFRYQALGITHTFMYPLTVDGGANRPIALCAPEEALSRTEK